jgi:hypothetical protein
LEVFALQNGPMKSTIDTQKKTGAAKLEEVTSKQKNLDDIRMQ